MVLNIGKVALTTECYTLMATLFDIHIRYSAIACKGSYILKLEVASCTIACIAFFFLVDTL